MQLAYRHDERPGESYEALDGKKACHVQRLQDWHACVRWLDLWNGLETLEWNFFVIQNSRTSWVWVDPGEF